jgi:hypothetical protein
MRWSIVGIVAAVAIAVDRRRLGADVTLGKPYIDRIDRIALCTAAEAFALARDQAMPELIPGRYALALELCSTRSDVQILLPRFLDETSSMRKPAVARTTRPKPQQDLVASLEHGGEYPEKTMPQAMRLTDAEGRSCIYVPITQDGKVGASEG